MTPEQRFDVAFDFYDSLGNEEYMIEFLDMSLGYWLELKEQEDGIKADTRKG